MKILNKKIKFLFLLEIICLFLLLNAKFEIVKTEAFAQSTMRNGFYRVQMGNLNSIAGESSGSGYNINITSGELAPGRYSGPNYVVRAGFQYINSIIPFYFSISSILIDFGTLTPTNPVTRTSTLTIDNQSAGGYIVTASENHQLLVPSSGALIPDTTCDGGTCNQTTSAAWTSNLTYGFGYRCDPVGTDYCATGFSTSTFYKQFADQSKSEDAVTVMQGESGRDQQVEITYKVNIASSQAPGLYTNNITYIATPTF